VRVAVWLASGIALVLLLLVLERTDPRASRERGGGAMDEAHAGGETGEGGAGTDSKPGEAAARSRARTTGRVLDSETGVPVPDARVWGYLDIELAREALRLSWPAEPVASTRSRADGTFALDLEKGRAHVVYASAPGYVTGYTGVTGGVADEIALDPGQRRVFRVVDEDGNAVRDAVGILIQSTTGWPEAIYRGTVDGALVVILPPRSRRLLVRAPGFATRRIKSPGRMKEDTIVLEPEQIIRGVVVNEEGDPLAGQPVVLDPSFRPRQLTTTDPEGRFGFDNLDEHAGNLWVERDGFLPYRESPEAGDDQIRVVLQRPRSLSGVVVFPDNSPVPRALVNGAVADVQGRFRVHGLRPGTNALFVRHQTLPLLPGEKTRPPAWMAHPKVEVPGPEVRVVLKRMARSFARLRFVDQQGRPVHKAGVHSHSATIRKLSDEQGRLVAAFSVPAGARRQANGIRNGLRFPFEATTYPTLDAPEQLVIVPDPLRATLIVRLPDGSPLPESLSASIQPSQWLKVVAGSRRHDRVSFHYDPLATWSFSATVVAPGYVRSRRSFGVPKQGEEFELRLERGVVITGVVISTGGAPVSGMEVNIWVRGRSNRTLLTAADGSFVSPLSAPGEVHVSVIRDELRLAYVVRRLKDEARLDLGEIRIGSPRLLEGRVVGPDKQPLAGVKLVTQSYYEGTATTRADGTYRMRVSPEDQEVLLVTKPGYGTLGVRVGGHGTIRMDKGGMIRLTTRRADPPDPRVTAWSIHVRVPGATWSWQPPGERIERKPGIWVRLYRDLPPGPLEVFVETTVGERAVLVNIVAGATVEAELTVP